MDKKYTLVYSINNEPNPKTVYVNLTNACTNSCVFCLREQKDDIKGFDEQQDDDVWVFDGIPYGAYFLDEYTALPTPEKDGYTFLGWYRNFEKGEGEVAFNIYDKLWDDQTFYAKWQEN